MLPPRRPITPNPTRANIAAIVIIEGIIDENGTSTTS
jgi:hypothetical protein